MYKDKAIEGLLEQRKSKAGFLQSEEIDQTIYDLRMSQHFFLGEEISITRMFSNKISDGAKVFEGEWGKEIGLPYNHTTFWLDVADPGNLGESVKSIGFIVKSKGEDSSILDVKFLEKHKEESEVAWWMDPYGCLVNISSSEDDFNNEVDRVDKDRFVINKYTGSRRTRNFVDYSTLNKNIASSLFMIDFDAELERFKSWAKSIASFKLTVLNACLLILNCRNITYEDVHPIEKVNKKRRKKGREEQSTYHELKISPMSPKKQSKSGSTGTGQPVRVHLCRGHFKTYTEDAPLFGRYTGRFWWQPQVRGQDKSGIVHKDYNVEV